MGRSKRTLFKSILLSEVLDDINEKRVKDGLPEIKQYDLANATGINNSMITRYMKGAFNYVDVNNIAVLAKVLGCDPSDLIAFPDVEVSDLVIN